MKTNLLVLLGLGLIWDKIQDIDNWPKWLTVLIVIFLFALLAGAIVLILNKV